MLEIQTSRFESLKCLSLKLYASIERNYIALHMTFFIFSDKENQKHMVHNEVATHLTTQYHTSPIKKPIKK